MFFQELEHDHYTGHKFKLVESATFYFPYLHVTNVLQRDMGCSSFPFYKELVQGDLPSLPPDTLHLTKVTY